MKNNFNWEEFLRVAQKLSEEKYDLEEDVNFQEILDTRAEEIKNKIAKKKEIDNYNTNNIEDLIDIDPDQIPRAIDNRKYVKIGKFMLCNLREKLKGNVETKIMENKMTGHGKDLICTVPVHKDFRFKEMPNIKLFNKMSSSAKLTHEQLVEIVRWLQIIAKYDFLV